jgi:HSP20 family molecular chaperone IbpA
MMDINQIRDELIKSTENSYSPQFSVTAVSPNRLYIEVFVPGFSSTQLRVKTKKTSLSVWGWPFESASPLYKPHPFSIVFPLCDLTVDSVDLADGILRIALTLEHPDAEKEYEINIPQPKLHPLYLHEDSAI